MADTKTPSAEDLAAQAAERRHHEATADPEVDGLLTGPAHEAKYGLPLAEANAADWRSQGLDPVNNGWIEAPETADDAEPFETAVPPTLSK